MLRYAIDKNNINYFHKLVKNGENIHGISFISSPLFYALNLRYFYYDCDKIAIYLIKSKANLYDNYRCALQISLFNNRTVKITKYLLKSNVMINGEIFTLTENHDLSYSETSYGNYDNNANFYAIKLLTNRGRHLFLYKTIIQSYTFVNIFMYYLQVLI